MSLAFLRQLCEGKNPQAARQHPPVLFLPPDKPRCHWDPQTSHPVSTEGRVKKTPVPAYQADCVPGIPALSLPPAHPARKSSAMARPREPVESYYSGPRPRLNVGLRLSVLPVHSQVKVAAGWGFLREALPWHPARPASPRTKRPAPPAAGAERNQWTHEVRTTPSAPGASAKFHWLGEPRGCGQGRGGWGCHGAQQTKTMLLGPARAAVQGRGSAVGTLRTGARNLPNARCEGRRSLCFDPAAPHSVWMRLCYSTLSSLPVSWGHGVRHTRKAGTHQGLQARTQLVVKVGE